MILVNLKSVFQLVRHPLNHYLHELLCLSMTKKKCVFCQKDTKKKAKTTYRVSEVECATKLLNLCRDRQDEIFIRLSTCSNVKDIFAADILYHKFVYYHILSSIRQVRPQKKVLQ